MIASHYFYETLHHAFIGQILGRSPQFPQIYKKPGETKILESI